MRKICLAYSGGLDTSVILEWLRETYKVPIVAFVADVGQGEDLSATSKKALGTGAEKVRVVDLKEEFVRDFVFAAIRAGAVYEGTYLLGTSLARPIIAKHLVAVAREEGCDVVSHGATGKGNDQVRFELAVKALAPEMGIIAPWREWSFKGRNDLIDHAERHGIPVPVTREKPYSMDANLMHISYEGGVLEDPWKEPPKGMYHMTMDPENAPNEPAFMEIEFEDGTPVTVNGQSLSPADLLSLLNKVGGVHGVGRVDMVENRFIGMKSRGCYETPGGTILHAAHRAVESLTMDREVMRLRDSMIPKIAELIYYGFWYSPEMKLLQEFTAAAQRGVTGAARMKLYKGSTLVVGRKAPKSLYNPQAVSFDTASLYVPKDAGGFINVNALRLILSAK